MMNRIAKTAALMLAVLSLAACSKDKAETVNYLDVTYANLNGSWQLAEWDGVAMDLDAAETGSGAYCYITFDRREHTFVIYQNFDSMYARTITGSFSIDTDDYLGEVISGRYDYDNGYWNHDYTVSELLSDSMVWTATDDPDDICKYIRVDGIPDSLSN